MTASKSFRPSRRTFLFSAILAIGLAVFPGLSRAEDPHFTVLAVMSYEQSYPWCTEILNGIYDVLGEKGTVIPFYMNTKIDFAGGPERARQAYRLFLELNPDGVIAADDNAQSMFVVPYLKDKVKTPVMFCGVNGNPEEYGYPASNVSGILERLHVRETLNLAKELVPTISSMGFIMQAGPSAERIIEQLEKDRENFPVRFVAAKTPRTLEEAVDAASALRKSTDILFMETLQGIADQNGKPLSYKEVMPLVAESFGKTVVASDDFGVRSGALCAVVKNGREQGREAMSMLLKAMRGMPVEEIPITRNREGKRMINVNVLRQKGISPSLDIVRSSELVKTEE